MIFLTVADAKTELSQYINGGVCDAESVVQRLNQATRRLLNHPKKPLHIRRRVRFWTDKDMITLPGGVSRILHYTMDGAPAPLFSQAYEFVSGGPGDSQCNSCIDGKYLHDLGDFYATCFDVPSMDDPATGEYDPVYSEHKLVAFSTSYDDLGIELLIQGQGSMNEKLLTAGSPGISLPISVWDDGVEGSFTADDPNLFLSDPVRDVQYVRKPVTTGFVSLYTYDPSDHRMYFLSKYHPGETLPRYRRYRITAPDYTCGSCILAWCELGYTPATHDDDLLLIQNMDALKMMILALEMEDERDFQAAKAHEADAYRFIENQRTADRTHDYNLIQASPHWGFGNISKA